MSEAPGENSEWKAGRRMLHRRVAYVARDLFSHKGHVCMCKTSHGLTA